MEWQPGILICPVTESIEGRISIHARYLILSEGTRFDLILFQQLLPGTRSSLHLHPVPETYVTLSGNLTLISLLGTEEVKIQVPERTVVRIRANAPHGVMNETQQIVETLILIGEGYREEDRITIRLGGRLSAAETLPAVERHKAER